MRMIRLHYCGSDFGHVGLLQNADFGAFLLPADPESFGGVVPRLSGR